MDGKPVNFRMHGVLKVLFSIGACDGHRIFANSCWALWIDINWILYHVERITTKYVVLFVEDFSVTRPKRILKKVIKRWSRVLQYIFIPQARCSIEDRNGMHSPTFLYLVF